MASRHSYIADEKNLIQKKSLRNYHGKITEIPIVSDMYRELILCTFFFTTGSLEPIAVFICKSRIRFIAAQYSSSYFIPW